MPLYEYRCEKCGELFEVMQKFSEQPLSVHEKCGGSVHRQLSAPALQFKGSGWYITDYAKSSKSAENGAPAEKSSSSDGKAPAASTDSKPAAPTPAPATDKTKE